MMGKGTAEWNIYTERRNNTSCFMFDANNSQPFNQMNLNGLFGTVPFHLILSPFCLSAFCSFDLNVLNFIYSFDSHPTPPHIQYTIYAHRCLLFAVRSSSYKSPFLSIIFICQFRVNGHEHFAIRINKWIQFRASLKSESLKMFK